MGRFHSKWVLIAAPIILAGIASQASAGPLPLKELLAMRTQTTQMIEKAQGALKVLDAEAAAAEAYFVKVTSDPALPKGAYEKYLAQYMQQMAEIDAKQASWESYITKLSSHLQELDHQVEAWRMTRASENRIATDAQVAPRR
jgi:hypothetical protein